MKLFIFDPLYDQLITDELQNKIKSSGVEAQVIKDLAPLSSCKELFEGNEERLMWLNPDYVGWKLSSDDYKNIPNLKAILSCATSFTYIDMTYANAHNVPVCNIRNFSTQAVAEWAIAMAFNVSRQIPRIIKDGFPLDFDKDFMKYRGQELQGKTAGIIGLGHIGRAIADRCKGLGMKVIYWSRNTKESLYSSVSLERLMMEADVIFPTMALNDETKKILTDELVGSMKSTAIFISIVHEMFNQQLVLDMVKNGKLFGFGFEAEPESFNKYEGNVWASPAYGWATKGSFDNSMVLQVDNLVNAVQGNFPNKVN